MKKIIYQLCTKLAACAFAAAIISVGTASCSGMYQPKVPDVLKKNYYLIKMTYLKLMIKFALGKPFLFNFRGEKNEKNKNKTDSSISCGNYFF